MPVTGRNDNGVRAVNFAKFKNLNVKITLFPRRNINKFTWTTPGGKTQIDHILIDKRRHSSLLEVRSFRVADCGTDNYLMVAKFRGELEVREETTHSFHIERFSHKKLNEVESKEHYCVHSFGKLSR
jgi:hypothetical protein